MLFGLLGYLLIGLGLSICERIYVDKKPVELYIWLICIILWPLMVAVQTLKRRI